MATMLGVVRGKGNKVFAGKSGHQLEELRAEIHKISGDWHTPIPSCSILDGDPGFGDRHGDFMKHVKNQSEFRKQWRRIEDRFVEEEAETHPPTPPEEKDEQPYNPPGQCAAQQMVLLALEHGVRPIGLTERVYNSKNQDATVTVYFRDKVREAEAKPGKFGKDKSVPPCGTCQIILTMLLCPNEQREPVKEDCRCKT